MDWLGTCHFCGNAVFKLDLYGGPSGPTDIDWRPWSIEDEVPPQFDANGKPVTKATIARWELERPYRLGLVVIDLQHGTYEAATNKPRGRLRPGSMHKLHMCEEKERVLYGSVSKTTVGVQSSHDHS
jgi:hypothetical protein